MLRRILILLVFLAAIPRLEARASPDEDQALKAANESFRLAYYERAEKDFGDFVARFTNSTHLAEAILLQAESRLKQSNFAGAISLLITNFASAGTWGDHYLYSLGQAHIGLNSFDKAAEAFGRIAREFPNSNSRIDASFQEARLPDQSRLPRMRLPRTRSGGWLLAARLER